MAPTKTTLGEVYGAYMLVSGATDNIPELQKRQNWIRVLGENQHLRSIILNSAVPVGEVEAYLFNLMRSEECALPEELQKLEPMVLEQENADWLLLKNPTRLPNLLLQTYAHTLLLPASWIALKASMCGFFSIRHYGVGAFTYGFLWRTFSVFIGAFTLFETGNTAYKQYQTHIRLYERNLELTHQLQALATFLEGLSKITQEPSLPKALTPQISAFEKKELAGILASIYTLTDQNNALNFHANLARAMIIVEQVQKHRATLERLLLLFGQLDFYASMAHVNLAYVDFLESPKPIFRATGLVHPSIPKELTVKNNVLIQNCSVLLTGPNASGKSTLMRSVGINILYFAQILGVGTADSLSLTPFSNIHAFMETHDKTGESSSYQTELNRIVQVLKIKTRSFYLADELFSSTNSQDALIGSQEILSEFSKLGQTLGIVSTHLDALSKLPVIQNYHMESYNLFQHASAKHNALEIFEYELSKPPPKPKLTEPQTPQSLALELIGPSFKTQRELKIDSNIWDDLEIFSLPIFPYQTILGKTYEKLFLTHAPTSNIKHLETRQKKIQALLEKHQILGQVRTILASFADLESSFLEIYDSKNWINSQTIQMQYPAEEELAWQMAQKIQPGVEIPMIDNRNPSRIFIDILYKVYALAPLSLFYEYKLWQWVSTGSANLYSKVVFGISSLISLQNIFKDPSTQHTELSIQTVKMVKKLRDTAQIFSLFLELAALELPDSLKFKLSKQEDYKIRQFIHEVRFLDGRESHFYQQDLSKALAAFRLLMDIRPTFVKQIRKIAQLDFYASIAEAMRLDTTGFSFAEFVTDQGSLVEARDLWNPLLDRKIAVTNPIQMGGLEHPRQIIITGPNASGKSTLMRSLAISIYLAQTLGVATASSFRLNPFTIFNSFMKHEDTTGTESSYQSEVKNMRRIMNIYENMSPEDKAFLILDEPFRSTNPEDAEIASGRVLQTLANYPQSLFIVATHLRTLNNFTQMHLENYKLQEGPSFESSALEMLREKLSDLDR